MSYKCMKEEAQKHGFEYTKKGRVLVWHDEFDKDKIDMDKWSFRRTMSAKDRIYDNSEKHCRMEENKALLQVFRTEDKEHPFSLCEGLTTAKSMNYKYGYIEMRANIPFRHGAWPSFWAQSCTPFKKASWMSEIDIFEVFSSTNTLVANLHKWSYDFKTHCQLACAGWDLEKDYTFKNNKNLNKEYHVYGFEWDPQFMTFYLDDEEFAKFPIDAVNGNFCYDTIDGVMGFHDFHFIIINNEIFSEANRWKPEGAAVNSEDELPIEYRIDWIRLYQNPEKEEIKFADEIKAATEQQESE